MLEEGGKFTAEVLFPLNQTGDAEGCTLDAATHEVTTPAGFKQAYRQFSRGRLAVAQLRPGLRRPGPAGFGRVCFAEMQNSANQAWTMYPGLTHGAYEALHAHGTPEQKAMYLPKLVSGEWTGTMCLTEPHSGTDLGLLRSKAEPLADGSYRLTGEKIFISAGEHDLAENIVHLVLARLPEAPQGSKGISLFVVPKFLVDADGKPRRAQRDLLRRDRAQDGHQRQRHLPDDARRRGRHAGRPAEQGPGGDVRDDERGAAGRRHAVARPDRGGLPERRRVCEGAHPDALAHRA